MPATIQAADVPDILIASLPELGRAKLTELDHDYQNTIALKRIFRDQKATIQDAGESMQFNAAVELGNSARSVGLGYTVNANISTVLVVGSMPWRHTHWNWTMERRLVAMNQGAAKILDIAKVQRRAQLGGYILLMERLLWSVGAADSDDPNGLPFFIVKSATAATQANNDGFNGTTPSGYSTVANLSPTTYPRWRNYSDAYAGAGSGITQDDLIQKMCRAQLKTDWMPLVDGIPTYDTGNDYGIYVNHETWLKLRNLLRQQNEDLGPDVAYGEGQALFMRTPFTPVKQLNEDSTDPVYMINWGEIGARALKGEWMKEERFARLETQPTMMLVVNDSSWNMFCTNRRKQAIISNGTTMP